MSHPGASSHMDQPQLQSQQPRAPRHGRQHWNKGRPSGGAGAAGAAGGNEERHRHRRATRTHVSPTGVQESGFSPSRPGGGGGGRRRGGQHRRHGNHNGYHAHRRREDARHAAAAAAGDGAYGQSHMPDYHVYDAHGDKGLILMDGRVPVQDLARMGFVLPLPWMHPEHQQAAPLQHTHYPAATASCYTMHQHHAPRNETPYPMGAPPLCNPNPMWNKPPVAPVPRPRVPTQIGVPPTHNAPPPPRQAPAGHLPTAGAAVPIVPPPDANASPAPVSAAPKVPKKSEAAADDAHDSTTEHPVRPRNAPVVPQNGPTSSSPASAALKAPKKSDAAANNACNSTTENLVRPRNAPVVSKNSPSDATVVARESSKAQSAQAHCDVESSNSSTAKNMKRHAPKATVVPSNALIAESITPVVPKKPCGPASIDAKVSKKSDESACDVARPIVKASTRGNDVSSSYSVAPSPKPKASSSVSPAPSLPKKASGTKPMASTGSSLDANAKSATTSTTPGNATSSGSDGQLSTQPALPTASKKSPAPTSIVPQWATNPIDSTAFILPVSTANFSEQVPPAPGCADKPAPPKKAAVLRPIPIVSANKMPMPTNFLKKKPSSRAAASPERQNKTPESSSLIVTSSTNQPPSPAAARRPSLPQMSVVPSSQ